MCSEKNSLLKTERQVDTNIWRVGELGDSESVVGTVSSTSAPVVVPGGLSLNYSRRGTPQNREGKFEFYVNFGHVSWPQF